MSLAQPKHTESTQAKTEYRAPTNHLLALLRLLPIIAWTTICFFGQLTARVVQTTPNGKNLVAAIWTHRWFHGLTAILGIRVTVSGNPPAPGTLIAPNHLGYADVVALGSAVECLFVAKSDVESWPVIGTLFRSSGQIAVARRRGPTLAATNQRIEDALRGGTSVCVFLEGTTSGGSTLLPFHASLLQPAINADATITPAGMNWRVTRPGTTISEDVAYWGDHVFTKHLWRLLGLRGIEVHIRFGAPQPPPPNENGARKALAHTLRQQVVDLLDHLPGDS